MHELSIAEALVAIAARHAGDRQVVRVEVRLGHLRQVVPQALEFGRQVCPDCVQLGRKAFWKSSMAVSFCR